MTIANTLNFFEEVRAAVLDYTLKIIIIYFINFTSVCIEKDIRLPPFLLKSMKTLH
jgi:hypothetical protein